MVPFLVGRWWLNVKVDLWRKVWPWQVTICLIKLVTIHIWWGAVWPNVNREPVVICVVLPKKSKNWWRTLKLRCQFTADNKKDSNIQYILQKLVEIQAHQEITMSQIIPWHYQTLNGIARPFQIFLLSHSLTYTNSPVYFQLCCTRYSIINTTTLVHDRWT